MPKFTILREGQVVDEVTLEGERIEMGSAHTCQLFVDDLLIALKQAVFVKEESEDSYRVEPLSRVPAFTLDGQPVDGPTPVSGGATLAIEGYEIRIAYEPSKPTVAPKPREAAPAAPRMPSASEPPLPEPLPEPPPPLVDLTPPVPATPPRSPVPPSVPHGEGPDLERTVFVRTVGRLVATAGPLTGQSWDLRGGETKIGRDTSQNQIVIRLDAAGQVDTSISRRHASIHVVGDRLFVEDQSSAAGTFVNGQQVPPGQKVEIRGGDLIEVRSARASTVLRLELGRRVAAPLPPPLIPPQPASPPPQPLPPLPTSEPPEFVSDEGQGFDPILSGSPADYRTPPERDRGDDREAVDNNPFLPRD
ncbi:MAG TPA: FHA domain-containing protein, partial [Acidobacteriota bacterium]|nr:FHA domain-containing protein [Acidobacteriota bacterium]